MKHELKRVDPLRAANVLALVYGLMSGAFAILFAPFFLLAAFLAPSDELGALGALFPIVFLFLYPVVGLVMGWVSGLLGSAIYNFIVTDMIAIQGLFLALFIGMLSGVVPSWGAAKRSVAATLREVF